MQLDSGLIVNLILKQTVKLFLLGLLVLSTGLTFGGDLPDTYGNDVDIMVEAKHKELAIQGFMK